MTQVGEGRSRAAADRLRAVADPDLYRHNPFRVLGLATEAGAREVRQKRQAVLAALDLGARAPVNDNRLPLPETPPEEDVRAAFDTLERADHRIVAELFWWWGEPGPCGCSQYLHGLHDIAVEAHARALDFEAAGAGNPDRRTDLWTDAADAWVDAIEEDGFWEHVRHRIGELSDRRLDESTVDGLKSAFPGALLTPQALLARRDADAAPLAGLMSTWDFDDRVIEDARVFAATPLYDRVGAEIKDVHRLLDEERASEAAKRALRDLPALGTRLEALVPHSDFRRSAKVRNDIAVALNNAGMALEMTGHESELRWRLLSQAKDFAVDPSDIAIISQNATDQRRYRTTGLAPRPAITEREWQHVTGLIQARQIDLARAELAKFRRRTLGPEEREQLEQISRQLALIPAGAAVAPYTWLANMALCFGTLIGVAWLAAAIWGISPFWAGLIATVVTFIPLLVTYSAPWRRLMPPALFGFAGLFALGGVVWWLLTLLPYEPETFIWAGSIFIFSLTWTANMAKRAVIGEVRM